MILNVPIQHKRNTAEYFTTNNPVLLAGEPALETDTLKEKIGDGVTAWNSLPYRSSDGGSSALERASINTITVDNNYISHGTNKHTQSGVRNVILSVTGANINNFTSEEFLTDGSDLVLDAACYSYDLHASTDVTTLDGKTFSFASSGDTYRIIYTWLGAASGWDITIKDYIKPTGIVLSNSYLFIDSPTPRTEVRGGDSINLVSTAENAESVEYFYKNLSGTWVSVGSATNTSGDIWTYAGFAPTTLATAIKVIVTYSDTTTQEVVNILYSISIEDTFTDVNGTSMAVHTPDSMLSSTGWTFVNGNSWEVEGNKLTNTSAAATLEFMLHDVGSDNFQFEFDITADTSNNSKHDAVLFYVDEDNYTDLKFYNTGSVNFAQIIGGVRQTAFLSAGGFTASGVGTIVITVMDGYLNIHSKNISTGDALTFMTAQDISSFPSSTTIGFVNTASIADDYHFDNVKIMPLTLPELNPAVSYTPTKLGTLVLTKNTYPGYDDNGISSPDFFNIGTTNYQLITVRNNTGVYSGIMKATAPTSDRHNWTRAAGYVLEAGVDTVANQISGSSSYWDGSLLHVVYSGRTDGIIYYANGVDVDNLTEIGAVIDLTGQSVYSRHPFILFKDGLFNVYFDTRRDQPSGNFGDIWHCDSASLNSLTNHQEILSCPSFSFDSSDIGAPSVRFNESSGYYEMIYSGFRGGDDPFTHEIGLAISKTRNGKFVRVSSTPLLAIGGSGDIDEEWLHTPAFYLDYDEIYYAAQEAGGQYDGITYATL